MGVRRLSLALAVLSCVRSSAAGIDGILWQDPADIPSRNLYYGPGGQDHQPVGRLTFLQEDGSGTNPKIVVTDEHGVEWIAKLGAESAPETAATRITWGTGYFAPIEYYVPEVRVEKLPDRLRRGGQFSDKNGTLHGVRLKLRDKKAGSWKWRDTGMAGLREFNGLRVLMAVLNNWDLTDENTAIYEQQGERIYMVGDLGSTFGTGSLSWPLKRGRGDLDRYLHSQFITHMHTDTVDFHAPGRPALFFLFTPREYIHKMGLRWIGREIPRAHARWLGDQMARLSPQQIRDAFRAAGYQPPQVEAFAREVERRVALLRGL